MSLKMKVSALAQQQFKATVAFCFPTDQVDASGNTLYGSAKFIGLFRSLPVSEARDHLKAIQELQNQGDTDAVIELSAQQMERYFIGFEAFPGEDFPVTDDNDMPLPSTADSIKQLLNIRELRDAVQRTYQQARSEDVLAKNLKR